MNEVSKCDQEYKELFGSFIERVNDQMQRLADVQEYINYRKKLLTGNCPVSKPPTTTQRFVPGSGNPTTFCDIKQHERLCSFPQSVLPMWLGKHKSFKK